MEDRIYVTESRIPEVDRCGARPCPARWRRSQGGSSATVKESTLEETKTKLLMHLNHLVKPLWQAKDIMFFPGQND
jgi:hypothetical protein